MKINNDRAAAYNIKIGQMIGKHTAIKSCMYNHNHRWFSVSFFICDPQTDYTRSAIGVLTVIPYESAVIAADIAMKSSGADIGFVDRFTGTLIITGSVSSVESAFTAIREYFISKLGYACCELTKT